MSMIKEQYHEEINQIDDDFELITDQEWQEYEDMIKNNLIDSYGYGTYTQLKLGEFLNKNGK